MEPITREEIYLAYLNGEDVSIPEPVTRREMYLYDLCMNSGKQDEGAIAEAVNDYLDQHGLGLEMDSNGYVKLGG